MQVADVAPAVDDQRLEEVSFGDAMGLEFGVVLVEHGAEVRVGFVRQSEGGDEGFALRAERVDGFGRGGRFGEWLECRVVVC